MLAIATDLSHTDFKQRDSNIYLIITSFVGGQTGQRDGLNVMKLSINTDRGDFTVNSDKLLLYRCDKSLLNDFSLQFKNYTKQKTPSVSTVKLCWAFFTQTLIHTYFEY